MNVYFAVRKVVQVVSLVLLMAVILYVIFRLMPGNPAYIFLASSRTHATAGELNNLEAQLGLSGGKWNPANFWTYLKDMFTFQFGYDYYAATPVWTLLEQALPYTLILLGTATILSYVFGLPLGIVTTWMRGRKTESALVTSSLIINSVPYFVLAILLFLYLAIDIPIAPVRAVFPLTALSEPSWGNFLLVATAIALPLASLTIIEVGANLLTMRAAMVSVLGEDFVLTARAKGVSEGSIMFRHAARNAMIPVSTRMALEFALIASGAVITEIIYSYPGVGNLIFTAIMREDYPLAEGSLFIISLLVILTYSTIDFIHAWLDPRIRL